MIIKKTKFKGLLIIKQKNNIDIRGSLRETFRNNILKKKFIFEYCTSSKKGVLRGFHLQVKNQQSKYVTVLKGKILDVVIDLRKRSKTFGKVFKIILSSKNALSLFIPRGFAHAYYSLEKENIIYYKLDNYYSPRYEKGILYNDKSLQINWGAKKIILSQKDKNLVSLKSFLKKFNGF